MKHRLIIIIVCMIASMTSQAQSLWDRSRPNQRFTFGLRAGMNFASTDMDYATSVRTGFHGGVTADWNIIKSFSVHTGLFYVGKGFKSNFGKGETTYLQIPLQLSYRIETPTGVLFHFNLGPYLAWGVSGTVQYRPYDATFTYNFDQNSFGQTGFFRHLDIGACAGAYIQIGHLLWGVGYEYGLYDIARVYGNFHNRNVTTTLGYNF